MDKQGFTDYLLSIGFNQKGAAEVIQRFDEDREEMQDFDLYKRFTEATKG